MTDEDIREISELMGEVLADEDLQELGELLRVRKEWPGLVGEETAARTRPYRLEGGRLFVGVESHAWAQELHFKKEEIKAGLREVMALEIEEIVAKKINLK